MKNFRDSQVMIIPYVLLWLFSLYMYALGRLFYGLKMGSLSEHAFPGNQTHSFDIGSTERYKYINDINVTGKS